MFTTALSFVPLAFAALLPLINPVGSALIVLGIVGDEPPEVYHRLAVRIALGMLLSVAITELAGAWMLRFFGVSLPVLQVSGGLVLAAMGWNMLTARESHVAGVPNGRRDVDSVMDQAFYPLTFPITFGPGAIVVVLTLGAHGRGHDWQASLLAHAAIFIASVLLAALVYLCYANAPRLQRVIPEHAASGVQRLISFILLCIGAQIAWGGLATLLSGLPITH